DGLASVGTQINQGGTDIMKQVPTNISMNTLGTHDAGVEEYKDQPMNYKLADPSYIDKVMISTAESEQTLIKVLTRQTRRPELGDKFSSRHGQKGVCGI